MNLVKILFSVLFFCNLFANAQVKVKNLPKTSEVMVTIKEMSGDNTISKSQLQKVKHIALKGPNADKFRIDSYMLSMIYDETLSEDEFQGAEINEETKSFFGSLEKDMKITVKDVVVTEISSGKSFRAEPFVFFVKVN
jgi:hypothetical protein